MVPAAWTPRTSSGPPELRRLREAPASTITFLVGNGDGEALAAWKRLKGLGVANVYVVEGGVNHWLDLYPAPACVATPVAPPGPDELAYRFSFATGESLPSAWPELERSREFRIPCAPALASSSEGESEYVWPDHHYTKRVKPQVRTVVKGGCG